MDTISNISLQKVILQNLPIVTILASFFPLSDRDGEVEQGLRIFSPNF